LKELIERERKEKELKRRKRDRREGVEMMKIEYN
jgi:hypothetical protein